MKILFVAAFAALAFGLSGSFTQLTAALAAAPPTLGGMNKAVEWIDLESSSNELPTKPFLDADTEGANRIGLFVTFNDGTEGTVIYNNISELWNSSFSDISAESATGFFSGSGSLHFLYNNGESLPMAWNGLSMVHSSNFDLSYDDVTGSHFRASESGWTSARFATYTDVAAVPEPSAYAAIFGSLVLAIAIVRRQGRGTR